MNTPLPTPEEALWACRTAQGQIRFARQYVLELLEQTPRERWFETPPGAPSNLAWQVGHLAVSQYGLLMFRQRGRRPEDLDLIPGRFRKAFARGSDPKAVSPELYSADQLYQRLAEVHSQALGCLAAISDGADLLEPIDMPYAVYPVKLGAILFCPLHEQIHAGQIGLLRRLLGLSPVR